MQLTDSLGVPLDPVYTSVSYSVAASRMRLPLGASCEVLFGGDRFLHGYISTKFGSEATDHLSIQARARQFSSFILVLGRIASVDLFDPKYAIVIQNKVSANLCKSRLLISLTG